MFRTLYGKLAMSIAFGFLTLVTFGQVANAETSGPFFVTIGKNKSTVCRVTSSEPVKTNNASKANSRITCDNKDIVTTVKSTLQHQTQYGVWLDVASNTDFGQASVQVGCRYGTNHNWRTKTIAQVAGKYVGTYYSQVSNLKCDI